MAKRVLIFISFVLCLTIGTALGAYLGALKVRYDATQAARNAARNFFNTPVLGSNYREGDQVFIRPDIPLPAGFVLAVPADTEKIRIQVGGPSETVLAYCQPVYGEDNYVFLYTNGIVITGPGTALTRASAPELSVR